MFHGSPDLALVIFPSSRGTFDLDSVVVRELNAILSNGGTGPAEVKVQALGLRSRACFTWWCWGR